MNNTIIKTPKCSSFEEIDCAHLFRKKIQFNRTNFFNYSAI